TVYRSPSLIRMSSARRAVPLNTSTEEMDKPNIFYSPKKHGLERVGEINFSNEDNYYCYTAVWRSISGTFYYGDDTDCHCCRDPFDRVTSPRNLNKADDLNKIRRHLERR